MLLRLLTAGSGTERHFAAAQRFGSFRMRSGHSDGSPKQL